MGQGRNSVRCIRRRAKWPDYPRPKQAAVGRVAERTVQRAVLSATWQQPVPCGLLKWRSASCQALSKPDADAHTVDICNDKRVSGGRSGVVGAQTQCNGVQLTRRRSKADPAPEWMSPGRLFQVVPEGETSGVGEVLLIPPLETERLIAFIACPSACGSAHQ